MSNAKQISTEEFDRIFDEGESIVPYLDMSTARHPNRQSVRRISMDMNPAMVRSLDREAERLGVNRQAVIKFACDGYLAEVARRERELATAQPGA